ncbi:MAG: hypothetical protein IJP83_01640, partial [Mycoplasma sp.]|nr:hypothetical protein [Mycoplasma sp.]
NAINNDSGVTARFSNNLYKNIKSNYLSVGTTLDIFKILANEHVSDISNDNFNLQVKIGITLAVLGAANAIATGFLFFYLFRSYREKSSKTKKALPILISILGLIAIVISNGWLISSELNVNSDEIEKIENLKKQWDKPAEGSDKFFQKISDDQKYFISTSGETDEKCQEEFNNLSVNEIRAKKSFYEQCKNKPADYEENPDKYKDTPYGMFKNSMKKFDEVNNILVGVSWRFNTVIIIDCIVFAFILACLIYAIHSYNKFVVEQDKLILYRFSVQNGLRQAKLIGENKYVNADGFEQAIANKNIIIRDANDFATLPGFDPNEYGEIMKGNALFGKTYWFCIKHSYYDSLDLLISDYYIGF